MAHALGRLLGRGVERQLGVALLALVEGHVFIRTIDRAGRGHQQVAHAQFARAFHHVECADDIGVDIGAGVFKAVAHPGLRGEVDDHIRAFGHGQRVKPVEVFQHPLVGGKTGVLQQHLVPPLFDPHIVVVGHAVVADDSEAFLEQQFREVKADEAGRAGDENLA